ncbi:MAG: hypothetical protein LRY55_13515 [Leadbetterella sp.]|nr:hypothetical protein [Leadbetterella sp.]
MKRITCSGLVLLMLGCGTSDTSDQQTVIIPDPLEEVKEIFQGRTAGYDSVTVEETDSTYTYFVLPETEEFSTEKELFGAFSIDKKTIKTGDLNNDGREDAVVQYSFTPHLDNNTLIYFKILLQNGGKLEETGEIYGGGRCEGPILEIVSIDKGVIRFTGREYADGDPCCCPSVKKDYAFKLAEGKIVPELN